VRIGDVGGNVCGFGPAVLTHDGRLGGLFACLLRAQRGGIFQAVINQLPDEPARQQQAGHGAGIHHDFPE
jgi:hypothetical protein